MEYPNINKKIALKKTRELDGMSNYFRIMEEYTKNPNNFQLRMEFMNGYLIGMEEIIIFLYKKLDSKTQNKLYHLYMNQTKKMKENLLKLGFSYS